MMFMFGFISRSKLCKITTTDVEQQQASELAAQLHDPFKVLQIRGLYSMFVEITKRLTDVLVLASHVRLCDSHSSICRPLAYLLLCSFQADSISLEA